MPTIDVDQAFAYKYKGLARNVFGAMSDLARLNIKALVERYMVLFEGAPDPFNTFNQIEAQHSRFEFKSTYFFLVGRYGRYDKNINPLKRKLGKIINCLSEGSEIGIHPSYASNRWLYKLRAELRYFRRLGIKVTKSRQHYLKLLLPKNIQEAHKIGH
ncbi:MAG: hypothetical protein HC896_15985 [Bacteroidales bacterium]|nr:hypothetical protein [Bacteroidales bacterium]